MKAYAKANIFLKLTGFDSRKYHLLESRFILLKDVFDELELVDKESDSKKEFEIMSNFKCENNIIQKAYLLLSRRYNNELKELFSKKSLKLTKNIPVCAGLGGGSSDCASFLLLMNETLNLKLNLQELINLSMQLGSDIAFFLSGFHSANVSGCGEIIEEFEDDIPNLKWTFPQISCQTKAVYDEFDREIFDFQKNNNQAQIYKKLSTKELLQNFKNKELNDLFTPCATLYPKMKSYLQEDFFLSGSGSSVFKVDR
ncbi:4-(cytidine 5'-diphospho)-2-C-methyl-D-erythritol kinase [Campylobacter sp. BCW_6875]|uniref:4-(cytidine 5'-diphospho)-2-C-methyl-D-erythritol kinase n=1 Tax=unclassified Campylobacter TaxID=2593542 RepID=UPI000875956D|nr:MULTISPECIES: 4-(cytidine 5'-diphospho)-2-C-methyl-D-erythritol kinase [unclassified Campylobacter]OEW12066.1 4-(cytidine 5'-diphospho)-2-C-methyl-D-erythritol kinase [Campylobacter sp. BCW_6875]OEW38129.1 4-(cytidine 5'-diphospho)-2-C-methyl-D-erythritol kinase [Campylobacter sp. BCW_6460]HEB9272904.1 4-(cytidine 5'-diphospho)-2-C-methyl-D-erythritol kinase [Campylobacter jejuni]HEB9277300.1 4-(cytidine 5'-diphospho)-2-C-methyl-D-erythritol kinase [Campylobacter jejuni]